MAVASSAEIPQMTFTIFDIASGVKSIHQTTYCTFAVNAMKMSTHVMVVAAI
jgi:hypothetical protein